MADQNYVSDELTHFVGQHEKNHEGQFTLLISILRSKQLRASYRGEFGTSGTLMTDSREPLTGNKAVREAAVCFCDIPVEHLGIHTEKYSKFGIAFGKSYLAARGASPVFYVANNAAPPPRPGIGPKTLGERWSVLRMELLALEWEMRQHAVARNPAWASGLRVTSKLPHKGTPDEIKMLGEMNALFGELDEMVFARIKFFSVGLPHEDEDNFYMEREWRVWGDFSFPLECVRRVIVPASFETRLRAEIPDYKGQVRDAEFSGSGRQP